MVHFAEFPSFWKTIAEDGFYEDVGTYIFIKTIFSNCFPERWEFSKMNHSLTHLLESIKNIKLGGEKTSHFNGSANRSDACNLRFEIHEIQLYVLLRALYAAGNYMTPYCRPSKKGEEKKEEKGEERRDEKRRKDMRREEKKGGELRRKER